MNVNEKFFRISDHCILFSLVTLQFFLIIIILIIPSALTTSRSSNIFFNVSFQFMAVTPNGLVGLNVVGLVVEEKNTVIVSAQILGQNTEDEIVATLDRGESPGLVTLSGAQVQVSYKNVMKVLINSHNVRGCYVCLLRNELQ